MTAPKRLPRILLLSAYDAKSHRYWHRQLVKGLPAFDWQVLTLKDRFFTWRMGGNALTFKTQFHQTLNQQYDLVVATSMTDLSGLLAFYPHLAQLPKILYFHENQFAYPKNKQQQGLAEIQLRSIYAAMLAEHLIFNSAYNRDSFLHGVASFIKKMPDGISPDLCHQLKAKASVLPVPIAADCDVIDNNTKPPKATLEVVWNHRWEHDKGPETLLALLRLCTNQPQIKFHIMGQQFRSMPKALSTIQAEHQDQCLTLGYVGSRTQYLQTLQQANVVLSTAHHDFQGIAVAEAVACGCLPVVPDRLVYPAYYPSSNRYPSTPNQPEQEAQAVLEMLQHPKQLQPTKWQVSRPQLIQQYNRFIQEALHAT